MSDVEGAGEPLRFVLLGPVQAWRSEEPLDLGAARQRAVLAVLLLHVNRPVGRERLIDAVWGDPAPAYAVNQLQKYVSALRRILEPGREARSPSGILGWSEGGYVLRVAPGGLDLAVFERRVGQGRRALAQGEVRQAAAELHEALSLWGSPALANVSSAFLDAERDRLAELRTAVLEERIKADLDLGGHGQLVAELSRLVVEFPLRESFAALLMLALYRSGRQSEALAVYDDTRGRLAEELGIDPGGEIGELHQKILTADATLVAPGSELGAEPAAAVRPAQLPPSAADFTGRTDLTRALVDRLSTAQGRITVVAGTGGVGKTTLTVHLAHAAREHFPDGQLYMNLHGTGPGEREPGAVLGSFLRALGTPDSALPDSTDERAALYRSMLDGRRLLVLLDNARDAAQVRPLLPSAPGCATLINSRNRIVDLAGAHLVDLEVMGPQEALELFTAIIGEERVSAERESALETVAACGFLPLAIRIAASRLASRRTWPVSLLAGKLADKQRLLHELKTGDLAVEATFELGYSQLGRQQARAFRLLGIVDGPDISLEAAAALTDLSPYETEQLLESLVDVSLLESTTPGRYRYHDLVQLHAHACAERDESPESRRDALSRLLDFYLATATHIYALERPEQPLIDYLEPTSHPGLTFGEGTQALEWLAAEKNCLLACVPALTEQTHLRRAADLLRLLADLTHNDSHQFERASTAVLSAARTAGDVHAQGRVESALVWTKIVQGHFAEADKHAHAAEQLGTAADDPLTVAAALNDQGIVALQQQRYEQAEAHFNRAITAFQSTGNKPAEASALCNLSRTYLATERLEAAIHLAQQGVDIYRRTNATMRLANAMYNLSCALTQSGDWKTAEDLLSNALEIFQSNRNPFWSAMTHFRLAELHLVAHRPGRAADQAERALALKSTYGELWHAKILTVLGQAFTGVSHAGRARVCWQEALTLYQQQGSAEAEQIRALLADHNKGPTGPEEVTSGEPGSHEQRRQYGGQPGSRGPGQ